MNNDCFTAEAKVEWRDVSVHLVYSICFQKAYWGSQLVAFLGAQDADHLIIMFPAHRMSFVTCHLSSLFLLSLLLSHHTHTHTQTFRGVCFQEASIKLPSHLSLHSLFFNKQPFPALPTRSSQCYQSPGHSQPARHSPFPVLSLYPFTKTQQ